MNALLTLENVHAAAALMLAWLGQAVLFGTALAALTWLVLRFPRRRVSPGLEVTLWAIVLVKFMVPLGPEFSFSLGSLYKTIARHAPATFSTENMVDAGDEAALAGVLADDGLVDSGAARPLPWATLLAAAYLGGVTSLLVCRVASYRTFRAKCLALPHADEQTRRVVVDVCRRLGVRRIPTIRISTDFPAPLVMGCLRPLLVLSHRQLVRPNELETVVVHEVTHLRRGDILVRYLQCIAGMLLFFWPVVAWVNRRIDSAREHACDQWALSHGTLTACEYARCLLSAAQPVRGRRLIYRPACMAGNPRTIERRIDVILRSPGRPTRRRGWGLLTVALVLAWGGFVLTGPARAQDSTKQWKPTTEAAQKHAQLVLERLAAYPSADADGDGRVDRLESYPFLTLLAEQQGRTLAQEYQWADEDGDGTLGFYEAYQLVRGRMWLDKAKKHVQHAHQAAMDKGLDKEELGQLLKENEVIAIATADHKILDLRERLIDQMDSAPSAGKVAEASKMIDQIEAKLAGEKKKVIKLAGDKVKVTGELADKIAELQAKLAKLEAAGETKKAAKVRQMLKQMEIEQLSAELATKAAKLKRMIADLEAQGETEKAARLEVEFKEIKQKLAKLNNA